jgi:hypothetical protein
MEGLRALEKSGNYEELIRSVRESIQKDVRILENPYIKGWLGRRWRNIFINEASKDEKAVSAATQKKLIGTDDRPIKQRIAIRFLKEDGPDEWKLEMPEAKDPDVNPNTSLLFCPGLLTGLLPVLAFKEEFPRVQEKYKINILQSDSHPMRSCEANMEDLLKAIDEGKGLDAGANPIPDDKVVIPKDLIIMTYSKGASDLLEVLVKRPDLKKRIKCIFNWAGAPGGSYLANSIYTALQGMNLSFVMREELDTILRLVSPVIELPSTIRRLPEYDILGAMKDLTTDARGAFLEDNLKSIDALNIPIFNMTGSTTVLEVPYFQLQGVMELNKYDANNDMQVTQSHSKINTPIATDLAMLHGHHWDLSYGPFPPRMRFGSPNLEHNFPRYAAACAIVKFAGELGFLS